VSPGAVDRAMHSLGLEGVRRRKKIFTTVSGPAAVRAPDLVQRVFTAPAPDRIWVTDFPTAAPGPGLSTWHSSWTHSSSRSWLVIPEHAATSKTVELVEVPLRIALWQRHRDGRPLDGKQLIHHSDARSHYTAEHFAECLALEGIRPSIGTVGDAYNNALMETINGLFKTECIRTDVFHTGPYKTITDVEYATAGWVDWYNNRRLHSTLGMIPPAEHEHAHYAALNQEPQPV
jgi:putative transposase